MQGEIQAPRERSGFLIRDFLLSRLSPGAATRGGILRRWKYNPLCQSPLKLSRLRFVVGKNLKARTGVPGTRELVKFVFVTHLQEEHK
jgi:hypothetical protein